MRSWWDGRPFAWLAGEHTAVRDLRRHLVEDRGVPKEDIEFTGYWRRGEVVALETDGAVPDPEKSITPFEKLHELTELVAPIAIRTAVELGVPELISRGVTSVADLAAKAGADERALGKLLRYLHALDVLTETEPGHYGLTPVGEVLTVEFIADRAAPRRGGRSRDARHPRAHRVDPHRPARLRLGHRPDLRRRASRAGLRGPLTWSAWRSSSPRWPSRSPRPTCSPESSTW